ncbi:MAG TPA: hypothetical protein PK819_02600, partial [Thermomicrobiales bacterium]|nr:hypothetical protein [Thermomicrobiales bacterium]
GKGDGQTQSDQPADSNGANQGAGDRDPQAPATNVKSGESTGSTNTNADVAAPTDSITLSRSPDAPGYKSGGASSFSSGSGSGAAAGAGSVEQGDVGEAGPDSNRVPDEYTTIVQEYFTDEP